MKSRNSTSDHPKRCALYARYSTTLTRPHRDVSFDDLVRTCNRTSQEATQMTVGERFSVNRHPDHAPLNGLENLLHLLPDLPRNYECVLVDDTSRLGRNLADFRDFRATGRFPM